MGKYIPASLCIASIYPGQKEPYTFSWGPSMRREDGTSTRYALEPVPKGRKAFVLEIHDSFQHSVDPVKTALQGRKIFGLDPVPAEDIAANLMKNWVDSIIDLPFGAKPGIMIIRGGVPHQDELEQMRGELNAYMEHYFLEGERVAREVGMHGITAEHRLAAEYLDRPRNWSHPSRALTTKPCPLCKISIAEDSIICGNCGARLQALPPEFIELQADFRPPQAQIQEEVAQ